MRAISMLFAAILFPNAAFAHAGAGEALTLVQGIAHPFAGTDHALAMVAVGVLAAVLGGRARLLVPLAFLAMMAFGFALAIAGVGMPLVELGIGLSGLLLGGIAAWGRSASLPAAIIIS